MGDRYPISKEQMNQELEIEKFEQIKKKLLLNLNDQHTYKRKNPGRFSFFEIKDLLDF